MYSLDALKAKVKVGCLLQHLALMSVRPPELTGPLV